MKKQRQHERYHLRWRIALIFDESAENAVIQGKTLDLSLYGAAVHTQHHLFTGGSATVLLAPPLLSTSECQKIIEIKANVVYSVYSCDSMCFRIGLKFLEFVGNSREVLQTRLSYHLPAFETRSLPTAQPASCSR